jgi:hypothetical protein
MVCAASLLSVFLGAALVWAAQIKVSPHVVALEKCGGVLLVTGLALLGSSIFRWGVPFGQSMWSEEPGLNLKCRQLNCHRFLGFQGIEQEPL